jgi:hypothetical protein
VFGVGLGLHIEPLIARAAPRVVVMIEPNLELLWHSLHVIDWAKLIDEAAAAGRTLIFLAERDAARIAAQAGNVLRRYNPAQIDGTYFFTHYPSSILAQARDRVRPFMYLVVAGLGFLEDRRSDHNAVATCAALFTDAATTCRRDRSPFSLSAPARRWKRTSPSSPPRATGRSSCPWAPVSGRFSPRASGRTFISRSRTRRTRRTPSPPRRRASTPPTSRWSCR